MILNDALLNTLYLYTVVISLIFATLLYVVVEIPLSEVVSICFKFAGEESHNKQHFLHALNFKLDALKIFSQFTAVRLFIGCCIA